MEKTEIEELREIFNSIMCLAVEGPDVMRLIEIVDKIAKESERGYDLCGRHLTTDAADAKDRCTCIIASQSCGHYQGDGMCGA